MTAKQRERRNRLIDAGLDIVMSGRDFYRVPVKEVADRDGVSLGALYSYFSSKEHLFAEVLVKWAGQLPSNLKTPGPAGPQALLGQAVHGALGAFSRHPEMARLVNVLVMSTDPFAEDLLGRLEQSTSDVYLQTLAALPAARARVVIDIVQGAFGNLLREWSLGRMSMTTAHERLDTTIDALFQ